MPSLPRPRRALRYSVSTIMLVAALIVTTVTASDTHAASGLAVTGNVTPPACSATLSNGGTVDYGNIPTTSLERGKYKQLPQKSVQLAISCSQATMLWLDFIDQRRNSRVAGITGVATDYYNYGLGTVDDKKVGGYALQIAPGTTADGVATSNLFSDDGGDRWKAGTRYLQHEGHLFSFGTGGRAPSPQPFTSLIATLRVDTYLNKPEDLPRGRSIPLDGATIIEVRYP